MVFLKKGKNENREKVLAIFKKKLGKAIAEWITSWPFSLNNSEFTFS